MNKTIWQRVRMIFEAANELPRDQRSSFLDRRCEGDERLRAEVERMLKASPTRSEFLESPDLVKLSEKVGRQLALGLVGHQVGAFRVERAIASGGMGTVYLATQDSPKRTVALKVMRVGFQSPAEVGRFRYEAEVVGRLRHPGIAQVYDAGTFQTDAGEERPYFAMEYVQDGRGILEFADVETLDWKARIGLFIEVCEAVHHGHQNGVVHRDLKPANILVDAEGRAKVIDFGVARVIDSSEAEGRRFTQVGEIIGTLRYMSPEQLDPVAAGGQIDACSDVYSLGVVLSELICGQVPYDLDGKPITEALRVLAHSPPQRPSGTNPSLPAELDWIVLKAVERERERRYGCASELAADLERLLANKPLHAGPPSRLYRARKFIQRHCLAVLLASIALLGLIGTTVGTTLAKWQAQEESARASRESASREAALAFWEDLFQSSIPSRKGADARVVDVMEHAESLLPGALAHEPQVEADLRHMIGITYLCAGQAERASFNFESALELLERLGLGNSSRAARILFDLAQVRQEQGEFEEAGQLSERALHIRVELGWEGVNDELAELSTRAAILRDLNRLEESEEQMRMVIARATEELSANSETGLRALFSLALTLQLEGKLEEAEEVCLEAVQRSGLELGTEHPDTIRALHNLATTYLEQGRTAEALKIQKRNYELATRVFGIEHPDCIQNGDTLAIIMRVKGDLEGALVLRDELAVNAENFPELYPLAVNLAVNRIALLASMGRLDSEEEFCRTTVARARLVFGDEDVVTLNSMHYLGSTLLAKRNFEGAEAIFGEVAETSWRVLPERSWRAGFWQGMHAAALAGMGEPEHAKEQFLRSYKRLAQLLGTEDTRTQEPYRALLRLYAEQGWESEREQLVAQHQAGLFTSHK